MAVRPFICLIATIGLLASGCSTKPRNFSASLSAPVTDRSKFENDFRTCQTLVRQGHTSNFKGAAASAIATGVGTVGAGAAMASAGAVGIGMGGGAAAAAAAAMPVVGVLIGFGVSRAIRGGKERKYKRAMEGCLNEYGYEVGTWAKARKKEDAASLSAANVKVSKSLPDVVADQSSQPSAAAPAPAIETSQPSE